MFGIGATELLVVGAIILGGLVLVAVIVVAVIIGNKNRPPK